MRVKPSKYFERNDFLLEFYTLCELCQTSQRRAVLVPGVSVDSGDGRLLLRCYLQARDVP